MITDIQLWQYKMDVIFLLGLWKKIFGFLAFKESLFEVNHWLLLTGSSFTAEINFMFEWV